MLKGVSPIAGYDWRPIRHCPGRFLLAGGPTAVTPHELVGRAVAVAEFRVSAARDPVLVATLAEGGLISYRRADGRYIHTLNTREGFLRKLRQLGIVPEGNGSGFLVSRG